MGAGKSTLFQVEVVVDGGRLGMITTDGPVLAIGNVEMGCPVAKAGIVKGDRIMSVDGTEIHKMSRQEAAKALKDALEESTTKTLVLVIGRKCKPDGIPSTAILLQPAVSAEDGGAEASPVLTGNGLSFAEESDDDDLDTGGGGAAVPQSPELYAAERQSYAWESVGEDDYDALMHRKVELKEMDLADDNAARTEWFALIAALDKRIPERARARSRESFDAAQREQGARAVEAKRANAVIASTPRTTSSKKTSSKDEKSGKESPQKGGGKNPTKATAEVSPDVKPATKTGVTVADTSSAAAKPPPPAQADAQPPPTSAQEAVDRILADASTAAWLEDLYSNPQPGRDPQRIAWNFLKMEAGVPNTMAAEVLALIEQLPFIVGAESGEGVDVPHAVLPHPSPDESVVATQSPSSRESPPGSPAPAQLDGAADAVPRSVESDDIFLPLTAELIESTAETTSASISPPLECPPGCTCLLCKVNAASDEGQVDKNVPLCNCGQAMILSGYKRESYKSGWFCDGCPTRGKRKGPRWFCFPCRHDLCTECAVSHRPVNLARDAKRRELTAALVAREEINAGPVGSPTPEEEAGESHDADTTPTVPMASGGASPAAVAVTTDGLLAETTAEPPDTEALPHVEAAVAADIDGGDSNPAPAVDQTVDSDDLVNTENKPDCDAAAATSYADVDAEERERKIFEDAKSQHVMHEASMLLDRAVALSPDRPISKSAAQGEGGRTAAEVNTEGTKTSLRAARLRRSASQLLEQLNKAMEEA